MARTPLEPAARFTCPIAPSTNNLFVNGNGKLAGKGRRRGAVYTQWLHDAGWTIRAQQPGRVTGLVAMLIEVPLNRRRDVDNCLKATIDLVVKLGLIDNDNYIDDLRIVRQGTGDLMTVSIWPMAEP